MNFYFCIKWITKDQLINNELKPIFLAILPCQVTSAEYCRSSPKTTQAWSSDRAKCTSSYPNTWNAATTANATPKQSSLLPKIIKTRLSFNLLL